jgi:putative transposase
VAQNVLRRLDKTFKAFLSRVKKKNGKAGFPRFKAAARYNSFCYPQAGYKLEGNKLTLSKIGSCRVRLSRQIEGAIKTCTIRKQIDGWFVIFIVEENQSPYIPKTRKSVGIDVGLENFATLSTGEIVENPRYLRESEPLLKQAQKSVARKKLRSSKRRKAIRILAKKHQKIANQRRDFFHKLSNQIIREFDEIAVEDLKIKELLKNHHLAKSINDAAWNTFLNILISKAESAGRRVWKVAPQFTSQDCSKCGERVRKRLSTREHSCISCGYIAHRDLNAAINIKRRADALVSGKVAFRDDPRILPH